MANLGSRLREVSSRDGMRALNEKLRRLNGHISGGNMSKAGGVRQESLKVEARTVSASQGTNIFPHSLGEVPTEVVLTPLENMTAWLDESKIPTADRVFFNVSASGRIRVTVKV